jgi:hypothetical protein
MMKITNQLVWRFFSAVTMNSSILVRCDAMWSGRCLLTLSSAFLLLGWSSIWFIFMIIRSMYLHLVERGHWCSAPWCSAPSQCWCASGLRQHIPSRHQWTSTRLHCATPHKIFYYWSVQTFYTCCHETARKPLTSDVDSGQWCMVKTRECIMYFISFLKIYTMTWCIKNT